MSGVRTVSLFLAMLAVLAEISVLVAVALVAGSRRSPAVRRRRDDLVAAVEPAALWIALAVASIAMLGSLYYSEVAHFTPCKLCWYQRIAMYPLVPVLAIAAWRRDHGIRPYVAFLATLGGAISVYHILVERFPNLESSTCDPTNPCSLIWVNTFGYLTIPTMALSAFALIAVLMVAGARGARDHEPEAHSVPTQELVDQEPSREPS
jgi:disulfide bond formation protein DsbB